MHPANEMAQLDGTFSNESFHIWVYSKEGNIPHFHFKNTKEEGCICLETPEYFSPGGKEAKLNSKQKKALVEFLQEPADEIIPVTNWQAILFLWNANNRDYPVKNIPMPDYLELE